MMLSLIQHHHITIQKFPRSHPGTEQASCCIMISFSIICRRRVYDLRFRRYVHWMIQNHAMLLPNRSSQRRRLSVLASQLLIPCSRSSRRRRPGQPSAPPIFRGLEQARHIACSLLEALGHSMIEHDDLYADPDHTTCFKYVAKVIATFRAPMLHER